MRRPTGGTGHRGRAARRVAVALTAWALVAVGCAGPNDAVGPTPTTAPGTTAPPGAPAEVAAHPGDWVLPGHDYDNSRAASGSSITADDVHRLQVAWSADLAGALTTVPLVVGDTVYVQDGSGAVSAIDRADGTLRWRAAGHGFNIGPFGVAVADGRVFAVYGSTGVEALDAATGRELWHRELNATPTTGIDIQPVVVDGLVLASTVPVSTRGIYTAGDRGVIHALDAATGDERWSFDTVEGDLWGRPDVNSGGGAWYPPAVDPARGVVYWGTANPAPFPGTATEPNGSSRPGPNLYTDSVVALDLRTGSLRWYDQVHPHDLFDRDLVHTMIARVGGRQVVIGTGKGGVVVGVDPATGQRLWTTPVGTHRNDDLQALDGPTEVTPGTFGGVLTPPANADGTVYVAAINSPSTLRPDQESYIGSPLGTADGVVVAVDAATGRVRWQTSVPGDPLGGVTVVNDLVMTALLDGTIVALDRADGHTVWLRKAPGGINGWMSVAGDTLVVPVGNASPPRLVAYRLR